MMLIRGIEFNDCARLVINSRPFRCLTYKKKTNTGLIISNLLRLR